MTNADLAAVLRRVATLADTELGVPMTEALEESHQLVGGDVPLDSAAAGRAQRVIDLLTPYATHEFDLDDLIYELLEIAGP